MVPSLTDLSALFMSARECPKVTNSRDRRNVPVLARPHVMRINPTAGAKSTGIRSTWHVWPECKHNPIPLPVPESFCRQGRISSRQAYDQLCTEAQQDHESYWARLARNFLPGSNPLPRCWTPATAPFFKWFDDGLLNVSYNCLDRHVEAGRGRSCIIGFESDDGQVSRITYSDLLRGCRSWPMR